MARRFPLSHMQSEAPKSVWSKIGWFIGLWVASVLALAVVAYGIKLVL